MLDRRDHRTIQQHMVAMAGDVQHVFQKLLPSSCLLRVLIETSSDRIQSGDARSAISYARVRHQHCSQCQRDGGRWRQVEIG
ncbi:hypothetical protein ACFS07_31955 [Undibacterium arcticum]